MSAPNPKDVEAKKLGKAPLDLLEPAADEAISRALEFGAGKYGVRNYVEAPIEARVYVAAIRRHLAAWLKGEDYAEDSGVHHLAHIGANVHVALAAIEAGSFVDNRHGAPGEAEVPCPDADVCQTCPAAEEDDVCLPHERVSVDPSGHPFFQVARQIAEVAAAPSWHELEEEPLVGPCPFRGLGNGGACNLADHFTGGYPECLSSCQRAERGCRS